MGNAIRKSTTVFIALMMVAACFTVFSFDTVNAASKGTRIKNKANSFVYEKGVARFNYEIGKPLSKVKKVKTSKHLKAYVKAYNKVYRDKRRYVGCYASSSHFVAVVIRSSGVDKNFPTSYSYKQKAYCKKSPKWKYVGIVPAKASWTLIQKKLKAGDLLFGKKYGPMIYLGGGKVAWSSSVWCLPSKTSYAKMAERYAPFEVYRAK